MCRLMVRGQIAIFIKLYNGVNVVRNWNKFVFILSLLIINPALSQTALPTVDLTNFKWGLKDSATNAVILEARYDYIYQFKNNVAIVKQDEYYGLINEKGREVAKPVYSSYKWVNDTLIKFEKNGAYGLVTTDMKEVMPFIFKTLLVFDNRLIAGSEDKTGVIDLKGNIIIPFHYDEILPEYRKGGGMYLNDSFIRVKANDRTGLINSENKTVLPAVYQSITLWGNDLVCVKRYDNYALLNTRGDTLIPFGKYRFSAPITEGFIVAEKDGLFGFVDSLGTQKIPFEYQNAYAFEKGMATVQKDSLWGVVNYNNEEVIPFEYASPVVFYRDLAVVEKVINDTSKFAYLKPDGTYLTEFIYDEVQPFQQSFAQVRIDDLWGLMEESGKLVVPIKNHKLAIRYGYVVTSINEKYGLYNLEGDRILARIYSFVYPPRHGDLIMVRIGDKYGYVDHFKEEIIPIIYNNARSFNNGRATVLLNGESFEISPDGERFGEPKEE